MNPLSRIGQPYIYEPTEKNLANDAYFPVELLHDILKKALGEPSLMACKRRATLSLVCRRLTVIIQSHKDFDTLSLFLGSFSRFFSMQEPPSVGKRSQFNLNLYLSKDQLSFAGVETSHLANHVVVCPPKKMWLEDVPKEERNSVKFDEMKITFAWYKVIHQGHWGHAMPSDFPNVIVSNQNEKVNQRIQKEITAIITQARSGQSCQSEILKDFSWLHTFADSPKI